MNTISGVHLFSWYGRVCPWVRLQIKLKHCIRGQNVSPPSPDTYSIQCQLHRHLRSPHQCLHQVSPMKNLLQTFLFFPHVLLCICMRLWVYIHTIPVAVRVRRITYEVTGIVCEVTEILCDVIRLICEIVRPYAYPLTNAYICRSWWGGGK